MSKDKTLSKQVDKNITDQLIKLGKDIAMNCNIHIIDNNDITYKKVDDILQIIHKDYVENKSDEGIMGIAVTQAALIAAKFLNDGIKGEWVRSSQIDGFSEIEYSFVMDSGEIFPIYNWCLKQIYNGEEDSILAKINALILNK